jgi:hypothetical protein
MRRRFLRQDESISACVLTTVKKAAKAWVLAGASIRPIPKPVKLRHWTDLSGLVIMKCF